MDNHPKKLDMTTNVGVGGEDEQLKQGPDNVPTSRPTNFNMVSFLSMSFVFI
jgi:hypothetical protein